MGSILSAEVKRIPWLQPKSTNTLLYISHYTLKYIGHVKADFLFQKAAIHCPFSHFRKSLGKLDD